MKNITESPNEAKTLSRKEIRQKKLFLRVLNRVRESVEAREEDPDFSDIEQAYIRHKRNIVPESEFERAVKIAKESRGEMPRKGPFYEMKALQMLRADKQTAYRFAEWGRLPMRIAEIEQELAAGSEHV